MQKRAFAASPQNAADAGAEAQPVPVQWYALLPAIHTSSSANAHIAFRSSVVPLPNVVQLAPSHLTMVPASPAAKTRFGDTACAAPSILSVPGSMRAHALPS